MTCRATDVKASDDTKNFHKIRDTRQNAEGRTQLQMVDRFLPSYCLLFLIFHLEPRIRVIFMTNFIDGILPMLSLVEPVRTIDDDTVNRTDVSISVHDALRN